MKTRIKYIKKNNNEGYYAVQVKRFMFWKTIHTDAVFVNVEKFIDTLAKIDEFNSESKSLNKIVYDGWAVRNVYKNTGPAYSISFFDSPIHKRKSNVKTETCWENIHNSIITTMDINTKKLFGKECLEPMRLRITIEQMDE